MLWVDSSRTRDSRKAGRKWFSVFSPLHQDGHLDPPCQGQRVSLLGELGGSQPGHHQLRQHRPCHAHRLPVCHHGGLDPDPLLGAFHKLFETIFSFRPIFIFVLLMFFTYFILLSFVLNVLIFILYLQFSQTNSFFMLGILVYHNVILIKIKD